MNNAIFELMPKSKHLFCLDFALNSELLHRVFSPRYGDKTPKSTIARVVSVVWILTGVICMAIFVAHITSVLTSFKLNHSAETIVGKKVR